MRRSAFTLIEVMVVVAIIGVILTSAFVSLYPLIRKEGFRKSVNDVQEVCRYTRAQAILNGQKATMTFHPGDGTFEGGGKSGRMEDGSIEFLDIGLTDYAHQEAGYVNFYPDGRCDEMTIVLRSDKNEYRTITLEITTGIATLSDRLPGT